MALLEFFTDLNFYQDDSCWVMSEVRAGTSCYFVVLDYSTLLSAGDVFLFEQDVRYADS